MALAFPVKYQAEGSLGLVPSMESIEAPELIIEEGSPGKIRLGPVRANIENTGIDGATLINYLPPVFLEWTHQDEYLIMGKYHHLLGYLGFVAVKASKRGNDVYSKRIKDRLNPLMELPDIRFFDWKDRSKRQKTRAIFTTLTYDPAGLSIGEAWNKVGEDYNRWISALRARYGEASIIRVWEAHKSGYPHVHAVIIFEDSEFEAFHHGDAWRVHEKRDIEGLWPHGFTDIEALSSTRGGLHYVVKYLGKLHTLGYQGDGLDASEASGLSGLVSRASVLTLSLMWAFRKRAFSMSRGLGDLIRALHNSNSDPSAGPLGVLVQADLTGGASAEAVTRWILLGFWAGGLIKEGRRRWSVGLSLSELRKLRGCASWTGRALEGRASWADRYL